jgi:hypothetical protein
MPRSRRERFFASWYWLILKNLIGWALILAAIAAAPLPGPAGVPLFLIGFALISFPGKRRLTARVLRGKPVRFKGGPFVLISLGVALALAALALALPFARSRSHWLATQYSKGPFARAVLYVIAVAVFWLIARATPHVLNLLLRLIAAARHKFRPWLRRHHIRVLPPRRRTRLWHEPGVGPFRLSDEILKFHRRRK